MEPLKGSITKTQEEPTITEMIAKIGDEGIVVFFSFVDDESSVVEASITDNFVESNHAVQDHIAIKPKIYRLRGCIGEVVYKNSTKWSNALIDKINSNPILSKTKLALLPISAISPIISNYTQAAKNVVDQIESSYNRYRKIIENNLIQSRKPKLQNKEQETTVAYLNRILELRLPVNLKGLKFNNILTAGDNFERKYYIQSVSAHQGNNDFISDIEVTIKEFRIATTTTTKLDKEKYGGYVLSNVQNQPEINEGQTKSEDVPKPVENNIKENVKNALAEHPFLYNVTKKVYNGLQIIGKNALENSKAGWGGR